MERERVLGECRARAAGCERPAAELDDRGRAPRQHVECRFLLERAERRLPVRLEDLRDRPAGALLDDARRPRRTCRPSRSARGGPSVDFPAPMKPDEREVSA